MGRGGGVGERRERDQGHEVLEAVAAAAFDGDAESEIWILVFGHDFPEALTVALATEAISLR